MRNNTFKCGDIIAQQLSGMAMGKPCTPPWATIFEGCHENKTIKKYCPNLQIYLRYLDDIFAIWTPTSTTSIEDERTWEEFKTATNNHCLTWIFFKQSHKINFMDLTISIVGNKLQTTLYKKPMVLYLYIPPHSSHPPGCLKGHICGTILCIFRLCSCESDIISHVKSFFNRMIQRGHKASGIILMFKEALYKAEKFLRTNNNDKKRLKENKLEAARRKVYLHLDYHPQSPPAHKIQCLFEHHALIPPGKLPLNKLGPGESDIPIDAMTIAYHCTLNMENLFSYRKLCTRHGPPLSSFL